MQRDVSETARIALNSQSVQVQMVDIRTQFIVAQPLVTDGDEDTSLLGDAPIFVAKRPGEANLYIKAASVEAAAALAVGAQITEIEIFSFQSASRTRGKFCCVIL